jgi:hypothetical protein
VLLLGCDTSFWLEMLARGKHSSLLRTLVSYDIKKFYNVGARSDIGPPAPKVHVYKYSAPLNIITLEGRKNLCLSQPGNPYRSGRFSTIDLLVLTSSDQHPFYSEKYIFNSFKTRYFNKEVNRTEQSLSVRVP